MEKCFAIVHYAYSDPAIREVSFRLARYLIQSDDKVEATHKVLRHFQGLGISQGKEYTVQKVQFVTHLETVEGCIL